MTTTELSADTRSRILETAWTLARERGISAVSVKDIAAAAGVSRQLIYFHYGNRAGLLSAMARHHDMSSGLPERIAEARSLPPVEALEELLRAWCGYVADIAPVSRALEAALITGDEGGMAWEDRFAELWAILRHAVRRIAEAGHLARGWEVETATDWLWANVQPSVWSYLVEMRNWTQRDFTERRVRSLVDDVVEPAARA
jgi:AcrR family transcriptional regulator